MSMPLKDVLMQVFFLQKLSILTDTHSCASYVQVYNSVDMMQFVNALYTRSVHVITIRCVVRS